MKIKKLEPKPSRPRYRVTLKDHELSDIRFAVYAVANAEKGTPAYLEDDGERKAMKKLYLSLVVAKEAAL